MTAPIREMPAATPITSYTELIGGIRAQLGELNIRYEDFDQLAGWADGMSGKVFGPSMVRKLGPEMAFVAICAAGLRLRLEIDPEKLEKMKRQIASNYNPRQANQARMGNSASPMGTHQLSRVFKHLSRLGAEARKRKMTKAQRSESAKHAATQRWIKHRKRLRSALKGSRTRRQRLALLPKPPSSGFVG